MFIKRFNAIVYYPEVRLFNFGFSKKLFNKKCKSTYFQLILSGLSVPGLSSLFFVKIKITSLYAWIKSNLGTISLFYVRKYLVSC